MKAKAMCIKRICMAFFDAAEDSAAISYYAKSFFWQWTEMTVLQMRGERSAEDGKSRKGIPFYRENF